ncbi:flagellar hook-associated protein FlgK [Bacillus sp. V5-8f]|uniref:flagellar hook-associated protein FlgK n=1 Tax=Bacillus sp. V5-8f TaxID=2053044 RepID=UPI000C776A81|nr:flagellar hook-associated protein FlgK [Bacillus sp. V5-8f]PLT35709.1 flagellar hook-associated protein FlgK [Bacillus sp. V5-8f]
MRSTFMGLETARRGMFTQQSALHTTGHNIANANTPGYTRQRVNFEQTEAYPGIGLNRPQIPGSIGTGVQAGSIQRVRESFLDIQYRDESNKLAYWETKSEALAKMEEIMNEPSDTGLSKSMDMFWQSLQDLAVDPTNAGARSVVVQRGVAVAETFNYLSQSLQSVKTDLKNEIAVTEKEINSRLQQISALNNQISQVEPHGLVPNDLYDERDRLLDELSALVDIKVEFVGSGGNLSPLAEGQAVVKLIDQTGAEIGNLISQSGMSQIKVSIDGTDGSVKTIQVGAATINFDRETFSKGKLFGLIESYGYENNGSSVGTYPDMLNELDNLAYTFGVEFNKVHNSGKTYHQVVKNNDNIVASDFFADGTVKLDSESSDQKKGIAGRISVSSAIMDNYDNVATAKSMNQGDGSNIRLLSEVINNNYEYSTGTNANFRNYFESAIGGMAVNAQEAKRLTGNTGLLQQAVQERRMSVSSVSLDEEMTNMIQFQHAYNASARMITLQDELLDKIINGMGTGGR